MRVMAYTSRMRASSSISTDHSSSASVSTSESRETSSSNKACWACSRAAASSIGRQQRLYFLPLPHGQGSLRPGLAITVSPSTGRMHPLYRTLLADARFHELLLAFDRDLAA